MFIQKRPASYFLLTCLALIMSGIAAAPAHSQDRLQQGARTFRSWDKNGDGFVTKDEFPSRFPASRFQEVDVNRDGKISLAEDQAYRSRGRNRRSNTDAAQRRSDLPEGTKVLKDLIYETVGERKLPLDLYLPPSTNKPLPLVIWIHGGGWKGGSKSGINRCVGALRHGYALASVEYRLSGEAIFPAAIEDCKAAVSYLRLHSAKYKLDPERFGVWGSSAGGHLVALLGTTNDVDIFDTHPVCRRASPTVQAVCNWFGPTDFLRMNDFPSRIDHDAPDSPESRFIGGPIQDHKEQVAKANPITYVSPSDPPMLLMHGDKDMSVAYNQSELLHQALQTAGVDSTLYRVVNGGHGFRDAKDTPEQLFNRSISFLDRHLKAKAPKQQELPQARAEDVGMSSDTLASIRPVLQKFVDDQKVPGAIAMVARRGKVVLFESVGWRDIANHKPMQKDSILRFFSMTKPVTSVAIMMLVEEGKIELDAPASTYLPELKGLQVFVEKNGDEIKLADADREMTIRDLLRHTSGLTYGFFGNTAIDKQYRAKGVLNWKDPLSETIARLGTIPLAYQPGRAFRYSASTDVLGAIVQRVSELGLDEFFQQRILRPLDMRDTSFSVPPGKVERFSNSYGPKPDQPGLRVVDHSESSRYVKSAVLLSGGGGLLSTARDYMRFCQMLLNKGELNGTRLLQADTVAAMTRNQLPPHAFPIRMSGGPRHGVGFGLGFSVVAEPIPYAKHVPVGEYGWGGAASTHFWISPQHELACVVLTQHQPFSFQLEFAVKPIVYAAIVD